MAHHPSSLTPIRIARYTTMSRLTILRPSTTCCPSGMPASTAPARRLRFLVSATFSNPISALSGALLDYRRARCSNRQRNRSRHRFRRDRREHPGRRVVRGGREESNDHPGRDQDHRDDLWRAIIRLLHRRQQVAPVISASYGGCEIALGTAGNAALNGIYQQGSAEGISMFDSAGDQGSTGCDNSDATPPSPAKYGLQVNGWASSPYITAVGGTDFSYYPLGNTSTYWNSTNNPTTGATAKGYIPEVPWDSTCTSQWLLPVARISPRPMPSVPTPHTPSPSSGWIESLEAAAA